MCIFYLKKFAIDDKTLPGKQDLNPMSGIKKHVNRYRCEYPRRFHGRKKESCQEKNS